VSKKKKKKKFVYHVGIPIKELWLYEVVATSATEARKIASIKGHQFCSVAGSRGFVERIRPAKEGDEE
jgi:hypothetical protein